MRRRILLLIVVFVVIIGIFMLPINVHSPFHTKLEKRLEDVVENVIGSVVHIVNEDGSWRGSGVLIKPDLILTARHVVENSDSFTITFNCGNYTIATKAISSKEHDLGFIKLNCQGPPSAKLGSIKDCRLGQTVFAIGSPYGKKNFNSVTLGIISGLNRNWGSIDPYTGDSYGWEVSFTTDAAGHPGNSGCPVFTLDGKVRGILVGGYSPVLVNCMPVDLVLGDIKEIERMFVQEEYKVEEEIYGPLYYEE